MFPLIGGILGGLGSLAGSIFSSQQSGANTSATIMANQANQQEAEQFNELERARSAEVSQNMANQQMAFQQQMSNTAFQRASDDMQKAGLNPAAMFGSASQASTPSGAMGSSPSASITPLRSDFSGRTSPLAGVGDAIKSGIASATQAQTIDNLISDNAKIKAAAANLEADSRLKGVQQGETATRAGEEESRTRQNIAAMPQIENKSKTAENELSINPDLRRYIDQFSFGGRKFDDIISPVSNLVSSARQWHSMMPKRVTTETTHSNGGSTFQERFYGADSGY